MKISDSKILTEYRDDLGVGKHDFYRCYRCRRLFTREEEKAIYARLGRQLDEKGVSICGCGSQKFSPGWPITRFFWVFPFFIPVPVFRSEWMQRNVIGYTFKLVMARGVAPWLERHLSIALPLVEKMVRQKEA